MNEELLTETIYSYTIYEKSIVDLSLKKDIQNCGSSEYFQEGLLENEYFEPVVEHKTELFPEGIANIGQRNTEIDWQINPLKLEDIINEVALKQSMLEILSNKL